MAKHAPTSISGAELPFKKRLILKVVPFAAYGLLRSLYALNRKEETGREFWTRLEEQKQPFLIAAWHETIVTVIPRFAGSEIHALTSLSFDGALAAAVLNRFKVQTLRGSSSKGGRAALTEMVEQAKTVKALAMTIDGPRGPRRAAKHGMASLSQRAGLPVVPIASASTKSIRLNTWDRTMIPKPFGTYVYAIGEAIAPPESPDRECLAEKSKEIETKLNALHKQLESEYGIDPQL